jgi:hypothetical protein
MHDTDFLGSVFWSSPALRRTMRAKLARVPPFGQVAEEEAHFLRKLLNLEASAVTRTTKRKKAKKDDGYFE